MSLSRISSVLILLLGLIASIFSNPKYLLVETEGESIEQTEEDTSVYESLGTEEAKTKDTASFKSSRLGTKILSFSIS